MPARSRIGSHASHSRHGLILLYDSESKVRLAKKLLGPVFLKQRPSMIR